MRRPFWSWTDLFRALGVQVRRKPRRRGHERYCRSLRTEALETRVYLSGEGLGHQPEWPDPLVVEPALVAAEHPGEPTAGGIETAIVPILDATGAGSLATTEVSGEPSVEPAEPPAARLPVVSARNAAVVEGEDAVFDIVLSRPSAEPVSVRYWTGNGTAEHARGDFARREGAVVFAPGETLRRVTIPTGDDALEEGDEHFWLFLTRPSGAELGDRVACGTIVDNDRAPQIDVSSPRVTEGQTAWFIVSLSNPCTKPVSVVATTEGGTAEAGKDFAPRRVTLTFEPGQTIQRVAVPTYRNILAEGSRGMTLRLSDAVGASPRKAEGVCTIEKMKYDRPLAQGCPTPRSELETQLLRGGGAGGQMMLMSDGPTLSVDNASDTEGETLSFIVSLSVAPTASMMLSWVAIPGSADSSDYSPESGAFWLAPGQSAATIEVSLTADGQFEGGDECFELSVWLDNGAGASAIGTIMDGDSPPTLWLDDAWANEIDGRVAFRACLSNSIACDVTFRWHTQPGSASVPYDFIGVDDAPGSIGAGYVDTSLDVDLVSDGRGTGNSVEATEYFYVSINSVWAGSTSLSESGGFAATGTIYETPEVTIDAHEAVEGGGYSYGSATLEFTLRLSDPCRRDVSIGIRTVDGTARAGLDYIGIPETTIAFPWWDESYSCYVYECHHTISVLDDLIWEDDECFSVSITSVDSPVVCSNSLALATIRDNDPEPSVTVAPATASESSGDVRFTVCLSGATERSMTVYYQSADSSSSCGPMATAGVDYTPVSGSVVFCAGQSAAVISVPITPDQVDEWDESFLLALSWGSGESLNSATATGTILDDDDPPSISASPAAALESNRALEFTLYLLGESERATSIYYQTVDHPGWPTADAGVDYESARGSFTLSGGCNYATIRVLLRDDTVDEWDEEFMLSVVWDTGGDSHSAAIVGTILNDDPPIVTIDDAAVIEGNESVTYAEFRVTLSAPSERTISVSYFTEDGSAGESANDFLAQSGTLVFCPGETTKNITVGVNSDQDYEGDEYFFVRLGEPTNASIGWGLGTGTIQDDDTIVFAATSGAVDEDAPYLLSLTAGDAVADFIASWEIDWGDGVLESLPCHVPFAMHSYGESGSYTITAQAKDSNGQWLGGSTAVPVMVRETTPTLTALTANGTDLLLEFSVSALHGSPFEFALFASLDGESPGQWLFSGSVHCPDHLSGGAHAIPITPAFADIPWDYFLVARVEEVGLTPRSDGGSQCVFGGGVFRAADGVVHVHGTSGNDIIRIEDLGEAGVEIQWDENETMTVSASAVHVRAHAGNDEVSLGPANSTLRLWAFGGAGDDTLTGALGPNILDGGDGTDTILDALPAVWLEAPAAVLEGEDAVFTLRLSKACEETVSVSFFTCDGRASAGDGDYESASGLVEFAPNETSRTIAITTHRDGVFEGDESFLLKLQSPLGAFLAMDSAMVLIRDRLNRPPEAIDDTAVVFLDASGNTTVSIPVLGNDWDPDGDTCDIIVLEILDASLVAPGGQLAVSNDGQITFPLDNNASALGGLAAGQSLTTWLRYTVDDRFGGRDTATVEITIIKPATETEPAIVVMADGIVVQSDVNIAFPATQCNLPVTQTLLVFNWGDAPLLLCAVLDEGTAFSVIECPSEPLAPRGGTGVIVVQCNANGASGSPTDILTLFGNDQQLFEGTLIATVASGTGVARVVDLQMVNALGPPVADRTPVRDPTISGRVIGDFADGLAYVEFDFDGNDTTDVSIALDSGSGNTFTYNPRDSNSQDDERQFNAGDDYDIWYRVKTLNSAGGTWFIEDAWHVIRMALIETSGPRVAAWGLRAIKDGYGVVHNPTVMGLVSGDFDGYQVRVEFDHDGNHSEWDGSVVVNASGDSFLYDPRSFDSGFANRAGSEVTLYYRVSRYGEKGWVDAPEWQSYSFQYGPAATVTAVVSDLNLVNDTGSSSTDRVRRRKTIIYRIWDVSAGDGFRSSNHLETRCGGCGLQRVRRRSLCDLWGIFAHPAKHEPPSLPSSASLRSGSQRSRAFRAGYLASCG